MEQYLSVKAPSGPSQTAEKLTAACSFLSDVCEVGSESQMLVQCDAQIFNGVLMVDRLVSNVEMNSSRIKGRSEVVAAATDQEGLGFGGVEF